MVQPVTVPFADGDVEKDFSLLTTPIPIGMSVPSTNNGYRINRHALNGLGYIATLGLTCQRAGYPLNYAHQKIADFGGYARGAIIKVFGPPFREYVSKINHNIYVDELESDVNYEGTEHWEPIVPKSQRKQTVFIDLSIRKLLNTCTNTFTSDGYLNVKEIVFNPTAIPRIYFATPPYGSYIIECLFSALEDSYDSAFDSLTCKLLYQNREFVFMGAMGYRSSVFFQNHDHATGAVIRGNLYNPKRIPNAGACTINIYQVGEQDG